jgi:hypothetical protein
MNASTEQVTMMWNWYEREIAMFDTELVIRCIVNRNDENCTRLPLYKENLEGLRVGKWVRNTVIDFFAWKTFKRLDRAGVPDIYKRFRIMDGSFMFYMHVKYETCNYNACRRMVTHKTVDENGHVWSFLSHDKICIPIHKHVNHWVLFVIFPADQQITIIYYLYDQGKGHVHIFDNFVRFIRYYKKLKELLQEKWAWHM